VQRVKLLVGSFLNHDVYKRFTINATILFVFLWCGIIKNKNLREVNDSQKDI
jgi:hypothetical protein